MMSYCYPDINDAILLEFVKQAEPFPGYWSLSEQTALQRAGAYLASHLGPRSGVRALDAGCGRGRNLPWIAQFAGSIVAADPDPHRLAVARAVNLGADAGSTNLEFSCTAISELGGNTFDFIMCSHVIQHVSTSTARATLSTLRRLSAPGSVALLAFSRSPVGHETFGLSVMDNDKPSFQAIDQATFDVVTEDNVSSGKLPVRMIDPDQFVEDARAAGWSCEWSWTYHCGNWRGKSWSLDQDALVNSSPPLLRECQGDVLMAMRPML